MQDRRASRTPVSKSARRALPAAAAVLATAVMCAPAWADTSGPATGASVTAPGQPAGRATIDVTRPAALTGKPVVIGLFAGVSDGTLPVTVNTTAAGAASPDGDCW